MKTEITATTYRYYPSMPDRHVFRIEASNNDEEIAWADLFVESDWAHFVYVYVNPNHRSEDTIMQFIRNAFNLDLGTTKIYWHLISPAIAHFYDQIVAERPDLTFAATGAINKISNA